MEPKKIIIVVNDGKEQKEKVGSQDGYKRLLDRLGVAFVVDEEACNTNDFESLLDGGRYTLGPRQQQQQQQQQAEGQYTLGEKAGESVDLPRLVRAKFFESRRESLEKERTREIPQTMDSTGQEYLGTYLKFVNREDSINDLLKHSESQYEAYLDEDVAKSRPVQIAVCSGGPGLGKTTFCRKAFTRAVDDGENSNLWKNVPRAKNFYKVVQSCVEAGRQYHVSFGGDGLLIGPERRSAEMSLAWRLTKIVTGDQTLQFPTKGDGLEQLNGVLLEITKGNPESLTVINFDETNMVMKTDQGEGYLMDVVAAVRHFNRQRKGFLFCILSGTNVRSLHDLVQHTSRQPPKEIRLPLLTPEHIFDVLQDFLGRSNPTEQVQISEERKEELTFVVNVLGGVPRYVELLVYALGDTGKQFARMAYWKRLNSGDIEPHAVMERVKEHINARYSRVFGDMLQTVPCKALAAYSLFGWRVTRPKKFGDQSVGDLETAGIVFLQGDKLVFPMILLLRMAKEGFGSEIPMLLRHFDVRLSSDENERNSLAIFCMKCAGVKESDNKITLKRLFPLEKFDRVSRKLYEQEMLFDSFQQIEWGHQITKKNWEEILDQYKTTGCFLVNGKGASFADMIMISKGGNFVVFFQEKQREVAKRQSTKKRKVPEMDYKYVKEEHDKCNVRTEHFFVLITDEHYKQWDCLQGNEIVLSPHYHEDAIGRQLALLRQHNHAHRGKAEER